ncbi:hypothetical protein FIBSPDRAFT_894075 [Athelia psychrophila]|uniref:Uncharacterized protein n=1 Tax=Athelia psychrophila TaxID=1759441 RepID=A0A166GBN7_9AGAM|nr:hypothetical protein FIBSPDRAFT_894075 [Fibularhizoctonia sp. CBS 109695]
MLARHLHGSLSLLTSVEHSTPTPTWRMLPESFADYRAQTREHVPATPQLVVHQQLLEVERWLCWGCTAITPIYYSEGTNLPPFSVMGRRLYAALLDQPLLLTQFAPEEALLQPVAQVLPSAFWKLPPLLPQSQAEPLPSPVPETLSRIIVTTNASGQKGCDITIGYIITRYLWSRRNSEGGHNPLRNYRHSSDHWTHLYRRYSESWKRCSAKLSLSRLRDS